MFEEFTQFVREIYGGDGFIALHEPRFLGNEKAYLSDAIDSTYVSSVGAFVEEFERELCEFTGARHAVATVNGTAALHVALLLSGVERGDDVITQSLSFVATCNAISYCGGNPVFVDVDKETCGMSPDSLESFLEEHGEVLDDGTCRNRASGNIIRSCVPMHTLGHPCRVDAIERICNRYNIKLVEDTAESLGSFFEGRHTGNTGFLAAFSFNGNKIVTTGGGGMILTNDAGVASKAKHLTTTAKIPHAWNFDHDQIGFNYRMPNINAALGCAQMEKLPKFLNKKRELSRLYREWCQEVGVEFVDEPRGARSNFWLNGILLTDRAQRDAFLASTNRQQVMTRPVWRPMHKLSMYARCQRTILSNTQYFEDRLVNIPSSVVVSD